jgi:hypothetical protein
MSRIVKISLGAAVCIGVFLISLPTLVHKAGLHPDYSGPTVDLPGKRALIITTSHGVLAPVGETDGDPTGVAASEMTPSSMVEWMWIWLASKGAKYL